MESRTFTSQLVEADMVGGNFAAGYQRGLQRYFYGEAFGTLEDHQKWLALGRNGDNRSELGDGYRSGVAGEIFDREKA